MRRTAWGLSPVAREVFTYLAVDCLHELGEIHRLHHVGVDTVSVALEQVRRLARGGKHHNGMAARADFEFAPAVKIIQRLRAVADDENLVGQIVLFQCGQGQFHVLLIVFDQEDSFDR